MSSHKQLKDHAIKILSRLNKKKLKLSIDLLQVLESDGQLLIHSFDKTIDKYCYTNIPTACLSVTMDHQIIGPRERYLTTPIVNKLIPRYQFDKSIIQHGTKFDSANFPDCVLKSSTEVRIRCGDRVVYQGYIFWSEYCGGMSRIYVTKEDYEQYYFDRQKVKEDDYNQLCELRNHHSFFIVTSKLQKIVHISDLTNELEEYRLWIDAQSRY